MRHHSSIFFFVALALVAKSWMVSARPSTALVVRSRMQASNTFFGDDDPSGSMDLSLKLEPDAPWEEFIMPSPTIIYLLGQLMVISGKVDFSLNPPTSGNFTYIRHPDSFRASLVQVSNDGWGAFMNAHKNMDEIQLYMQEIPGQVKAAITILSNTPSADEIQRSLPIPLKSIQEIGHICVQLSAETESKFSDVMLLLGELLEATTSSQGHYEKNLTETEIELNVTREEKVSMDHIGEVLKNRTKEAADLVASRQAIYDAAVKAIPTGFKAWLRDLAYAFLHMFSRPQVFERHGHSGGDASKPIDVAELNSLSLCGIFFDAVGTIKGDVISILNGTAVKSPADVVLAFTKVLDSYEDMFKTDWCDLTEKALGLVDEGRAICKKLQGLLGQHIGEPASESDQAEVEKEFDSLLDELKPYVAQAQKASGGLGSGDDDVDDVQTTCSDNSCNERFKADLALSDYRYAERRQDQVFAQTLKYYEEMKALIGKMAQLKLEDINYKDILDVMRQGIRLLGKIRQQWSKLVEFFSLISVRAEVALNQTMGSFLSYAKQAEEFTAKGGLDTKEREFYLGLLEDQAVDINKVAYFLYTLSSTYFDVSSRYLIDRLAGLADMLAADTDAKRQQLLGQLGKDTNETQDAIKELAEQRRKEYKGLIKARQQEIQNIINNLGGPNDVDTKAIQSVYGKQT